MNKIAIPALLVATVMVAGAFAFLPVEQASTVHTTAAGQGINSEELTDATPANGDTYGVTCTTDYTLLSVVIHADAGATDTGDERMTLIVGGENIVAATDTYTVDTAVFLLTDPISGQAADEIVITNSAGVFEGDEDPVIKVAILGGGACNLTETT